MMGCFAYIAIRSAAAALGNPDRAFIGILLFTPVLLLAAGAPLLEYAAAQSGEPLAAAVAVTAPGGAVRYDRLLQPGHRLPARPALGAGERDRARDHQQLPGALPRHAALARPVDAARRRARHRPRGSRGAARAPGTAGPAGYMEFFRDGRFSAFVRR